MDIYSYVELLLQLDDIIFSRKQFKNKAQNSISTTNTYISNMEKIGLVNLFSNNGDSTKYQIIDPKIVFALKKKLKIYRG